MFGGGKRKIWIWALVAILVLPPLSDFVSWSLWRQALQRQADHAAVAGARALLRGEAAVPAVRNRLARLRDSLAEPPAIEYPPADGAYEGRMDAIRVRLAADHAPFFHSLLFGASRMRATATAAILVYRSGDKRALRVE